MKKFVVTVQQFVGKIDNGTHIGGDFAHKMLTQLHHTPPQVYMFEDLQKAIDYATYKADSDKSTVEVKDLVSHGIGEGSPYHLMKDKHCHNVPIGYYRVNIKTEHGHEFTAFAAITYTNIIDQC